MLPIQVDGQERSMIRQFGLDSFDSAFAARTTADDWQRILVLRDHPRMVEGILAYRSGSLTVRPVQEYFAA